ncbi:MAG TPA: hypothetical protein DHV36_23575 [Desulfobacteraceae bacterium]|nr:hypothetical protein [Desulfobacteraceae bacterium]
MNLVSVFTAKPGMVLAREVKNKDGRHLMDAGTTLGDKEIRILKMWGIPEVMVQPAPGAQQKTDTGDAKLQAFLGRWFKKNPLKDPVAEAMYNITESWFSERPEVLLSFQKRLRAAAGSRSGISSRGTADPLSLLNGDLSLPALPQIYSEINTAVNDPKCSGKDIAEIVSKDTSLSATLLKIVNSAFYGRSEKIDSLTLAAMTLGTKEVCNLALGITVINHFKGMPETFLDMDAFWRHSVGCGIMARNLATHIPEVNGERVFIGGLLHDIGRLVLLNHFPEVFATALAQAAKLGLTLHQVEPKFFSLEHGEFGSMLADFWNLPAGITRLIRDHHAPLREAPDKEVAVVYFANWMVSALGIGFSGEITLPALSMGAWKALGISPGTLIPVVRQTERQLAETIRFFL